VFLWLQVVGIPGFVDGKIRQLSRQLLQRMNIAQLQVVVNDLHTQIEGQNPPFSYSMFFCVS